jgi:glutathione-regulated potassium-efflux system ancillary protein KefC
MVRVGAGAYDTLRDNLHKEVCGVDVDRGRVTMHCKAGRNVILADAEDPDFWAYLKLDTVQLIMLAMPAHLDILETVKQLQHVGFQGKTAGIARYHDQKNKLLAAGIDEAFDFYAEAGVGFAEQSILLVESK